MPLGSSVLDELTAVVSVLTLGIKNAVSKS